MALFLVLELFFWTFRFQRRLQMDPKLAANFWSKFQRHQIANAAATFFWTKKWQPSWTLFSCFSIALATQNGIISRARAIFLNFPFSKVFVLVPNWLPIFGPEHYVQSQRTKLPGSLRCIPWRTHLAPRKFSDKVLLIALETQHHTSK